MRPFLAGILVLGLVASSASSGAAGTTEVQGLRFWSAPDHTRIVVDLSSAAAYTHRTLVGPDRIVVELPHTVFANEMKDVEIGDGRVARVSPRMLESGTAQVVVEVPERPAYDIFPVQRDERRPDRIVVDVMNGGSEAERGAVEEPASRARERDEAIAATDPQHEDQDPAAPPPASENLTAKRVSLNLDRADLSEALRLLLASRDMNLVLGEGVEGSVSVQLTRVPFEEALNVVLTVNGLSYFQQDNTLYVFRKEDAERMAPDLLHREIATFRFNYAPLGEMSTVLKPFLSPAGTILPCPTLSTLVVEDAPANLRTIQHLVDALDIPPRQVLIRAHIIDVTLDDDTSLGIEWDYLRAADLVGQAVDMEATATLRTKGFSPTLSDGLFFSFATSGFEAFLDALQQRTATEVLASPTVLALDGHESDIIIGSKLGFRLLTTTPTGNVMEMIEFLDVGTQLTLTPHIGDDGLIILEIHPEVSDGVVDQGIPSETTTETTTTLIVQDGATILIGGLMRTREELVHARVPILGSVPVLGRLFQKSSTTKVKSEVLVGITPHIVTPQGSEHMAREVERIEEIRARSLD